MLKKVLISNDLLLAFFLFLLALSILQK